MDNNLRFTCGEIGTVNGHTIKALTPDENGAYTVVVGALEIPTRNNVVYDSDSLIRAMSDPTSRFNICLKDGCLAGEYGHPVIKTAEDMSRLLMIDEHYISHYFQKIWVDETPVTIKGKQGYRIMAKVKPYGPYGAYLEKSLRDPCHNTSFSIRSVCIPMNGPDPKYEYRKVQLIVTFDAVHAPGFEITNKRYAGNESFEETTFTRKELEKALSNTKGMESSTMITDKDIMKLYNDHTIRMNGEAVATNIAGNRSFIARDGSAIDAASLLYRRK